jgi:hypothetical protein
VIPCPWCLSTPPWHDRCDGLIYQRGRVKVGEELDSVGATVPVYDRPEWLECPCECRRQEPLW